MIRLLVDCHCFDGKPEGITTFLKGIYQAMIPLAKEDVQFILCASDIEHLKSVFGVQENVEYVAIPKSGLLKRLLLTYPKLVKQTKADYAHFQYTIPFSCACKRIVTMHDVFFEDFRDGYSWRYALPRHLFFRYAARHAEFLYTMCEYCRERISYHYGIDQDKIRLSPNAVSEKFPEDVAKSTMDVKAKYGIAGMYILYLSRKEPRKNHLGLLKVFVQSELWKEGVVLALVGRVSVPLQEFDAYLSTLPESIREKVLCIDHVDYDELCGWYRQASGFAFPSLAEGFGIPPLEAATCGLPVLCSNKTSMGEFTFFGDNLIDPDDENAMIKGLIRLVMPSDRTQLEAIKAEIYDRYTWQKTAERFLKVMRDDYLQEKSEKLAKEFCGR